MPQVIMSCMMASGIRLLELLVHLQLKCHSILIRLQPTTMLTRIQQGKLFLQLTIKSQLLPHVLDVLLETITGAVGDDLGHGFLDQTSLCGHPSTHAITGCRTVEESAHELEAVVDDCGVVDVLVYFGCRRDQHGNVAG